MSISVDFVHMPRSESLVGFVEEKFRSLLRRGQGRQCDLHVRVEGTAKSPGAKTIEFKVAATLKKLMGKRLFVSVNSTDARDAVMQSIKALEKKVQKAARLAGHGRSHFFKSNKTNWAAYDSSLEPQVKSPVEAVNDSPDYLEQEHVVT